MDAWSRPKRNRQSTWTRFPNWKVPVVRKFVGCIHTKRKLMSNMIVELGLYSLSGRTSYRKISRSLEATRFEFKLPQSLWNLTATQEALLPRGLSNFRAIRSLQHQISRLRVFTRSDGKTSAGLVKKGPDVSMNDIDFGPVTYNLLSYRTH